MENEKILRKVKIQQSCERLKIFIHFMEESLQKNHKTAKAIGERTNGIGDFSENEMKKLINFRYLVRFDFDFSIP